MLKQGPNKQNYRFRAPTNPHELIECKEQGSKKAMYWMGLVNGRVLVGSLLGGGKHERGGLAGDVSGSRLASSNQIWYMQDGATCHTTKENLNFILE